MRFGQADRGEPLYQTGSRGAEVKLLQQYLTRAGFDTKGIDGVFGNNTFNAVVNFQKTYNIPADGIVYIDTFEALANVVAAYEAVGVTKLAPREAGSQYPDIQDTPLGTEPQRNFTVEPVKMGERPVYLEPLPPLYKPGEMPWTTRLLQNVPLPLLLLGSLGSLGVFVWALSKKKTPRPAMAGYSRRKRRSRR